MQDVLTDIEFEKFRNLIYDSSGIHFSSTNRSILESRIRERLKAIQQTSPSAYYDQLKKDSEELKLLLDAVTTNLTRFFRNTAHFETLEHYVVPDLVQYKKPRGDREIRVWSAGCSTGEEPYTIAMVLKDVVPPDFHIKIVASDISLKSLMVGKEGFYPEPRVQDIPEKDLNRYLEKKGNGFQVKDELKQLIRFDYHNLKHDSGLRNLDIVFCRNVLIYFDEPAQKEVVERFWEAMGNHAFLFIGHSESLFGMKTRFEFVKTDWACIYRKFLQ